MTVPVREAACPHESFARRFVPTEDYPRAAFVPMEDYPQGAAQGPRQRAEIVVGLLDRLKWRRSTSSPGERAQPAAAAFSGAPSVNDPTSTHDGAIPPSRSDVEAASHADLTSWPRLTVGLPGPGGWVPPGVAVQVGPVVLPGGMLYVGKNLAAANGHGPEPALIDGRLGVDFKRPDRTGSTVGYWPAYHAISSGARAAYLTWLADGRRAPGVPISWVFLFFYGLERRVLVDAAEPGPAREEVPAIRAEVERLLRIYTWNNSFRSYASGFLDLLDMFDTGTGPDVPPPRRPEKWPLPTRLRARLGEFAASSTPVPTNWALAWAYAHPAIYLRTPATRCADEFEELFLTRYTAKHGAGLVVRPTGQLLQVEYQPASSGLRKVRMSTRLPDVLTEDDPTRKLVELVQECTNALEAYSRYIGRNPEGGGTLAASALLPPELVSDVGGEVALLNEFVDGRLAEQSPALIDAGDLLAFWPTAVPGKATKADTVALAQLLGAHGVGVEPDVRLGGAVLTVDAPAVLFRTARDQPASPSPEYAAATVLLHLAAAVSIADGEASAEEITQLADHLESAMHLSPPERVRLHAHLVWLLAGQTKLTGLAKRLAVLQPAQRESIGDFLTTVAAADGVVSPAEITTLTKIFKLLQLDVASVYSRVHAATTGDLRTPPATEPVIVRPTRPGEQGYAIPVPPTDGAGGEGGGDGRRLVVRLDEAAVAAKLAETAAVSALLGSIFADDDASTVVVAMPAAGRSVAGLDPAHSALLRILANRIAWSRADFEGECDALGLLPDGAIDTLNEAAYETAGDPVADGDDPINVDPDVAQEMQT